jgi:hypothetical protein
MTLTTVKKDLRISASGQIVLVTPEMAADWLANQIVNRPKRNRSVKLYLDQFRSRTWECDPLLPLLFNTHGQLADGQHRLHALIEHGEPVAFYVRTVSDIILRAITNTVPRTMRDRLQMDGVLNASAVGAIGIALLQRKMTGSIGLGSWNSSRTWLPTELTGTIEEAARPLYGSPGEVELFVSEAVSIYSRQPRRSRLLSQKHIGYLLCQTAEVRDLLIKVCDGDVEQSAESRAIRKHLLNWDPIRGSDHWPIFVVSKTFNHGPQKIYRFATAEIEDLRGSVFGEIWNDAK